MKVLHTRGLEVNRLNYTPAIGELVIVTDTKQLYTGDGKTPGGIPLLTGEGGAGPSIPIANSVMLINHGENQSAVRPNVGLVYWYGSVNPANAIPYDIFVNSATEVTFVRTNNGWKALSLPEAGNKDEILASNGFNWVVSNNFYTKDNVNDLIDSCITKISSTATKLPMQRNGKDVYSKEIDIPYLTNTTDLELTSDEKSRVDEIWIDFQNSYAMSGKYATGITRVKVEGTTHNLDWAIDTETFNLNLETLIAPENSGDVIVKVVVLYTLNPVTP